MPAMAAGLCCIFWRHQDHDLSIKFRLVLQHGQQFPPAGITDRPRQFVVPLQVSCLQVFGDDQILVLDLMPGIRMKIILPLACYFAV